MLNITVSNKRIDLLSFNTKSGVLAFISKMDTEEISQVVEALNSIISVLETAKEDSTFNSHMV